MGKSRLFYEFKLPSRTGCLVLETFSVSHGKAYPYLPLIDLLKNYFRSPSKTTSAGGGRRSLAMCLCWTVVWKTLCPISFSCTDKEGDFHLVLIEEAHQPPDPHPAAVLID